MNHLHMDAMRGSLFWFTSLAQCFCLLYYMSVHGWNVDGWAKCWYWSDIDHSCSYCCEQ